MVIVQVVLLKGFLRLVELKALIKITEEYIIYPSYNKATKAKEDARTEAITQEKQVERITGETAVASRMSHVLRESRSRYQFRERYGRRSPPLSFICIVREGAVGIVGHVPFLYRCLLAGNHSSIQQVLLKPQLDRFTRRVICMSMQ